MAFKTNPDLGLSTGISLPQWAVAPSYWQHLLIGFGFVVVWCMAEWTTEYFQSGPSISGWYLPAGLGLALLWGLGLRYVWALGLAAWIGGCYIWDYEPGMSVAVAALKMLVYSAHAAVLMRILPPNQVLQKPMQVISAIASMLVAPMFMAIGGIGILMLLLKNPPDDQASAAMGWWVGDTIGILATAPLLVLVLLPMAGRRSRTRFLSPARSLAQLHDSASDAPPFAKPLLASIAAAGFILLIFAIPITQSTRVFLLGFIVVPSLAVRYGLTGALLGLAAVSVGGLVAIAWKQMSDSEVVDLQLMMVALGVSAFFAGSFASMRQSVMAARLTGERWTTLALKGSQMGRWLWDVDHNRIYTDHVLSSQLGYTVDQVKFDISWWIDLAHEQDIETVRAGLNDLIAGDTQTWIGERRLRAADGSWRWIRSYGTLVGSNSRGEGRMIAGIHQDITEQKRLQQIENEALAQRHREEINAHLLRTEKLDAIGIFASGIAHDFHNTLLAISASAQSARKQIDENHSALRPLNVVDEACKQAREITASLLAFARGQGASKEPINLKQTIQETAKLLDALLPSSIVLDVHVSDDEPWVMGNRSEIQQVLMNLAMNARDAIPDQGKLEITLDPLQVGSVELHITDSGNGMTQDVIDRAFEPFYTTKARLKGTGLGLALVHGIITDHDGAVVIHSKPDVGTRVSITLPLYKEDPNNPFDSLPHSTTPQERE